MRGREQNTCKTLAGKARGKKQFEDAYMDGIII
jgi:hypothetical protein